jgi:hypothetical protein
MGTTVIVGSLDTKGPDFELVRDLIEGRGHQTLVIDTSVIGESYFTPDVGRGQVTQAGGSSTAGLIDGVSRQNLEKTGMGHGLEVEMVQLAHEMDLLTCPYVFGEEDAVAMAEAGADVLVPHMGLTTKGDIGAQAALDLGGGQAGAGDARCRQGSQSRGAGTVPRWADRRASGDAQVHLGSHRRRRWLLRRVQH